MPKTKLTPISVPSKLGGIVVVAVILLLVSMIYQRQLFSPWSVIALFFILTYVGACEPSYPYDMIRRLSTLILALLLMY